MRVVGLVILLGSFLFSRAQESHESSSRNVVEQFQLGAYDFVVSQLVNKQVLNTDELYLLQLSQLELDEIQPADVELPLSKYPNHPLGPTAKVLLARKYFYSNEPEKSQAYLKDVSPRALSPELRGQYYLIKSHHYLNEGQLELAEKGFQLTRHHPGSDKEVKYYQGYVAYQLDKKEEAIRFLEQVDEDDEYGTSARFFIGKIKLEDQLYDEVIALAQGDISEEVSVTNSGFHQLIGEAYARKEQTTKSSAFFEKAIEKHPGNPSPALYYQAGVAQFRLGNREKAITYLTQSGLGSGEYANLSAFQLGRLYVKEQEYDKALAAYIEASRSEDVEILEESSFMMGKLYLQSKDYTEGITYLNEYLKGYEGGKWKDESLELLAEAYLRTSNYDQAIEHFQSVGVQSSLQKEAYQKSTYQKAYTLYQDAEIETSIDWFKESLKYPINNELKDAAHYYLGEAYFRLSKYDLAINSYQSISIPTNYVNYALGYAFYNQSDYTVAVIHFEKFLDVENSSSLKQDALLRLGDCYFATKEFNNSLKNYRKLEGASSSPYVQYQIGLVQKNLRNDDLAITAFETVRRLPANKYEDAALFQIASIKFENTDFSQADFFYSQLIEEYPESPFLPEAYLNRAICKTNLSILEAAKQDYEWILDKYIQSEQAFSAILGLQELESKGVEVNNLSQRIENYKQANPDDQSLEVVEFEYAKSRYYDLAYDEAILSLKAFVADYHESSSVIEARYYLADALYRQKDFDQAKTYLEVLANEASPYKGRVLLRLGEIYFLKSQYNEAINVFKELDSLQITPKDSYNGKLGVMKSHFAMEMFRACEESADEIIESEWKPYNGERNAMLFKAKSLKELGETIESRNLFNLLTTDADAIGAESSYQLAHLAFTESDYKGSLELLFNLNTRFGSYREWVDRSYLLIAENYIQLNELFQAKATLRSIIQHSSDEETVSLAKQKLSQIETSIKGDTTKIKG